MEKVLFITGIFAIAIILRRLGIVRERHTGFIVRYVMTVSLPCLTIISIGALDLGRAHIDIAVIAWIVMVIGALISYGAGRSIGLSGNRLRVFILASTFPNTAFLGYPFTYSLFGENGLSYAIIYDQLGMFPLFLSMGFFIAGGRESLLEVFRFPPFIALVFAVILNSLGLTPSGLPAKLIGAIGWTTLPLTIFIIGLKVRFPAGYDLRTISASLFLRMLLMPGLLFIVLYYFGMTGVPYSVTILESAMPPALMTGIVAMQYRLDEELAVSCISIGTVLSLIMFAMVSLFR